MKHYFHFKLTILGIHVTLLDTAVRKVEFVCIFSLNRQFDGSIKNKVHLVIFCGIGDLHSHATVGRAPVL